MLWRMVTPHGAMLAQQSSSHGTGMKVVVDYAVGVPLGTLSCRPTGARLRVLPSYPLRGRLRR